MGCPMKFVGLGDRPALGARGGHLITDTVQGAPSVKMRCVSGKRAKRRGGEPPMLAAVRASPARARGRDGTEGAPLNVIQRQLGHANLGITSIYLQGIDSSEIIDTTGARRLRPRAQLSAGITSAESRSSCCASSMSGLSRISSAPAFATARMPAVHASAGPARMCSDQRPPP
jgi:hypothetical protein